MGAGPAGASLALLLARQGIAVDLVEKHLQLHRHFRGEALMPSGLEALARMNLWPLPAPIRQRELRGWTFFLEGRLLFEILEPMASPRPCTLIDQPGLLSHLVSEASLHSGFRLHCGSAATELGRLDGRINGVRLADGTRLQADLVVACDGRGSQLRQQADLRLKSGPSPIDVLWFRLPRPACEGVADWLDGRFITMVGPSGSFALFETSSDAVQLGWALPPAQATPAPPHGWPRAWADNSPRELATLLEKIPAAAVEPPLRLPVRVGWAPCWHRPGFLLLGDAAHPMSPVRAQGINMALRDALVTAERLVPALRQGTAAAIDAALAQVQAERSPEILTIQRLQHQEASRGELLRRQDWIRRLLATTASWSGPVVARRWVGDQHLLRHGLPLPGAA